MRMSVSGMKNGLRLTLPLVLVLLLSSRLLGQHEHHHQPPDSVRSALVDSVNMIIDHSTAPMTHSYSLILPMNRNGSGTGWLTDLAPMYGYMRHSRKWMYMIHGNVFVRYNHQDVTGEGDRGGRKVDAPNWFMGMAQRKIGQHGLLHFNVMLSLDPLFGGEGYPLLFQTGETFKGKPLVDRQHPHNLFSELCVAYTREFTSDLEAFVYLGYPGEPALGPVAFMHRPSSMNNPDSPLGHHWQDATHITFGVATMGLRYKFLKLDGSIFTGREPGEARYGLDRATFDSYSFRLTANPTSELTLQVSRAFINSPETLRPEEDVRRTTASATHTLPLIGMNRSLTSTLVWGHNDSGGDHREHSVMLESNLQLDRTAIYGRYEAIQKSAEELQIENVDAHSLFNIRALTIGASYTFLRRLNTNLATGCQATIFNAGAALDDIYGKSPLSVEIYIRIYPALMTMP